MLFHVLECTWEGQVVAVQEWEVEREMARSKFPAREAWTHFRQPTSISCDGPLQGLERTESGTSLHMALMRKHLLLLWPGDKAGSPRMSQKGEKNSTHSQCQVFGEKLFPMACKVQSKKGAPCSKAEQAERRVQRGMQHCLLTGDAGGQDCSLSLSSFLNTPFSFLFLQSAIFKSCEGQCLY